MAGFWDREASTASNGAIGTHVQEYCDEIVIGLEGEGSVEVSGRAEPLTVGAVIELPLGATLAISNGSREEALRYLIVKASRSR